MWMRSIYMYLCVYIYSLYCMFTSFDSFGVYESYDNFFILKHGEYSIYLTWNILFDYLVQVLVVWNMKFVQWHDILTLTEHHWLISKTQGEHDLHLLTIYYLVTTFLLSTFSYNPKVVVDYRRGQLKNRH